MLPTGQAIGRPSARLRSEFNGQGVSLSGSGNLNIGRDVIIGGRDRSEQDLRLLADLRSTDPHDDKTRIERTKGGLLRDSYHWILDHDEFRRWRHDDTSRLLWIKGDPGKGKTMLLCGIIDEINKSIPDGCLLSYFFCQATDARLNNAAAVLRGLIYQLLDQEPSLIGHLRKKYDHGGKQLFEDVNSWDALSTILISILEEPGLEHIYLIIDALDECETNLNQLLHLIVRLSSSSGAKLLVSSRNWPNIEDALADATQKIRLSLELNQQSISEAVGKYIQYKVNQLSRSKNYDEGTRDAVQQHLAHNANDTFLWVALVCQELADPKVRKWHTRTKLRNIPPGLDSLYARMMDHLFNSDDADLCRQVLSVVSIAYRPLHLLELKSLVDLPEDFPDDVESLTEIIGLCGSLLTLREGVVYFVHQSAKDFLLQNESERIHLHGISTENRLIALRLIQVMSTTLRRDIYNLRAPGFSINQVETPDLDPLAPARYSCVYWVNHLVHGNPSNGGGIQDDGPVYEFLKKHFLHWLEALSLLGKLSDGALAIKKLSKVFQTIPRLGSFTKDASKIISKFGSIVERAPLQIYSALLLFSPLSSEVRQTYWNERLPSIKSIQGVKTVWDAHQQTFEGHTDTVSAVAFSPDGQLVASGSHDTTVRLWNIATGTHLYTLEGHNGTVYAVAFSPDGQLVASGSYDATVRLWTTTTGMHLYTLESHNTSVHAVAFSPDSQLVASGSQDKTVRLWTTTTGTHLYTLEGHDEPVNTVVFLPDSQLIASGSSNGTVRLWNIATGTHLYTLEGHDKYVHAVAFSPNGQFVASASETLQIWNVMTRTDIYTLKGYDSYVFAVAFSPDGELVASGSTDAMVRIWDVTPGVHQQTLESHDGHVRVVTFSPDGRLIASGSKDKTVRLWTTTTGTHLYTLKGHNESVDAVAFSPDGQVVASASSDATIRLWNAKTGTHQQTIEGHRGSIWAVAYSPNGDLVASSSISDTTVWLWNAATGMHRQTLEAHTDWIEAIAFSPDGQLIASGSRDKTIRLWDAITGLHQQTLEGHSSGFLEIVFSPNGQLIASVLYHGYIWLWDTTTCVHLHTLQHDAWVDVAAFSPDGQFLVTASSSNKTIWLWSVMTGTHQETFESNSSWVYGIAFSPNGQLIAVASSDKTVRVWNATTCAYLHTLRGHGDIVTAVKFSPDSQIIVSASYDKTVRLWDATTGTQQQMMQHTRGFVRDMTFSSDGQLIVSVSRDELDRFWNLWNEMALEFHSYSITAAPQGTMSDPVFCGLSFDADREWVVKDAEKTIWLPPEYRPGASAIRDSTIVIGCASGQIIWFQVT